MFENVSEFFTLFHFIHPLWLVALLPLAFIYWFIKQRKASGSGWSKVIDAHLLSVLIKNNQNKVAKSFSALLMTAWVISVLALANPTWEKRTMPVFQTNTARVIVLDLSRSMEITDLKPSRLARARFKVEDMLAKDEEGQIGLVVFAGDAFTVTPLTRDADTIRSLLKSLTPSIMPIQGSRADLGLLKAGELLEQAAVQQAQIILMADGAEAEEAFSAAKKLKQQGYTVSVLSIGTTEGAAIPRVRDRDSKPIIVGMDENVLKEIATIGGGRYAPLSSDSADIDSLLSVAILGDGNKAEKNNDLQSKDWKSEGPWLVLLLLPLAALAFRRGWLLSVGLVVIVLGQPQPVLASGGGSGGVSLWDSLWKRKDQQADLAFQAGDYEQAQKLSEAPLRRGSAAYKKGDFEQALKDFSQVESADGVYNKGNALAKLNKFEEAIKAYDQVLKQQPDMQDAKENKARIEELLKKQKEQQEQNKKNKQRDKQQDKQQDSQDSKDQQKDNKSGDNKDREEGENSQDPSSGKEKPEKGKEGEQSKENQFANANDQEEKSDAEKIKEEEQKEQKEQEAHQQESKDGKESEEERQQMAKSGNNKEDKDKGNEESKTGTVTSRAEALNKEEKVAAEQWLRRIPDDPGGLLKRKFKYQYRRRGQREGTGGQSPW